MYMYIYIYAYIYINCWAGRDRKPLDATERYDRPDDAERADPLRRKRVCVLRVEADVATRALTMRIACAPRRLTRRIPKLRAVQFSD